MKKYIFRYCFIIGIIVVLYLIKDKQPTLLLSEYDDYLDKGIVDGFTGTYFLLLANACFSMILCIATATTTMIKANKVKFKYVISSAIIITLIFIFPMVKNNSFGGEANISQEEYISMFTYVQRLFQK